MTGDTEKSTEKRSLAQDLMAYAQARYSLLHSTDGRAFAVPADRSAPHVARELGSVRGDLAAGFYGTTGRMVGGDTAKTVTDTLSALALGLPAESVPLRAMTTESIVAVDLGDPEGRVAMVSDAGWRVEARSSTAFRRTTATRPLPVPEQHGRRDDLRDLLGLEEDDPRWRQIWGWLVGAFFADVPRPLLYVLGPQGSGKSTAARMILDLVDPASALGREPGRNERDDTTGAAGRFVPSWDNVSTITPATSDWFCRLVTGVEVTSRQLFTDDGLHVSSMKRTGLATGIVLPFGAGPDLLERLVLVELDRVPEERRRAETQLRAAFERARPRILGALLDDVALVLRNIDRARIEAKALPRMADYALILRALDRGLPPHDQGFADAYSAAVVGSMADRADADPLTAALVKVATSHPQGWTGTAEQLLRLIDSGRPEDSRAPWPTSPSSLSGALARAHETLRAVGLTADRVKSNGVRKLRLGRLAE